tara:strand:+ start:224 stop:2455 length:2232 start_codon:yes stop_codon:yes gene_type:complete
MDDQKLDKILKNMDTPAIDANAKKRALNLAMAEFDSVQKEKNAEKEKKFQGFQILSRLMGISNTETNKRKRNAMEQKSHKKFIYGGMATAAAVIIVAGIGLQLAPNFDTAGRAVLTQPSAQIKPDQRNTTGGIHKHTLETSAQQDFDSENLEELDSLAPQPSSSPDRKERAKVNADLLGDSKNMPEKKQAKPERELGRTASKAMPSKDDAVARTLIAPMAPARSITTIMHEAEETIALAPADIMTNQYQDVGRDKFSDFTENPFKLVTAEPISTFSADVDTASYSFVRRQLNNGVLPQKDAVRIEELINYFDYDYALPDDKTEPFKPNVTITESPWNAGKQLMHIGIKGYEFAGEQPNSNIVFLLDVSGSMNSHDKLPLVKNSMKMLLGSLKPDDTVSIAVYAGAAGTVLEPTKVSEKAKIIAAFDRLSAGGSTAGAAGINLAYQLAEQNFDENAVNRVILATDGDFNVGINNREELKDFVERKREKGIFLSVLGFGQGNYNDDMMQALAQNGNGVAAYIDTLNEARKVLVEEATSSLFPIAKDVKFQVEFNPNRVSEYRLVGYETRALNREDFNNDAVDAGDIGAGHSVTAIYEITPVGATQSVDPLRYGQKEYMLIEEKHNLDNIHTPPDFGQEIAFLKMRYKLPKEDVSKLITQAITQEEHGPHCPTKSFCDYGINADTQFATAVASFAQILKGGKYTGKMDYDAVIALANASKGNDPFGYRAEFIQMVRLAQSASDMQP